MGRLKNLSASKGYLRLAVATLLSLGLAPWLNPGSALAFVAWLMMQASVGPTAASLAFLPYSIYSLAAWPLFISGAIFLPTYLMLRRFKTRVYFVTFAVLLGAVITFACFFVVDYPEYELSLVSLFIAMIGASSGLGGSMVFLWIVEGPDVDGHREGRADWHR